MIGCLLLFIDVTCQVTKTIKLLYPPEREVTKTIKLLYPPERKHAEPLFFALQSWHQSVCWNEHVVHLRVLILKIFEIVTLRCVVKYRVVFFLSSGEHFVRIGKSLSTDFSSETFIPAKVNSMHMVAVR